MRDRERQPARQAGNDREMEGRGHVAITDRAQENREYVRTLLKNKEPELAARLERLELELPCLRCRDTVCGSWPVNGVGEDGGRGHERGRAHGAAEPDGVLFPVSSSGQFHGRKQVPRPVRPRKE
jgi:hypothetical protein